MSGSLNKVTLIGNLGADPEVRTTQDGRQIVNLNIATTESWRDKMSGERRDKTEWHKVVIFSEGLTKVASQYLKKGSKIYIEGSLQTRKWQDKEGQDRYTTEIVLQNFNGTLIMLDGKNASSDGGSGGGYGGGASSSGGYTGNASFGGGGQQSAAKKQAFPQNDFAPDLDDEVPF